MQTRLVSSFGMKLSATLSKTGFAAAGLALALTSTPGVAQDSAENYPNARFHG